MTRRAAMVALAVVSALATVSGSGGGQTEPEPPAKPHARRSTDALRNAVNRMALDVGSWGGTFSLLVIDVGTGKALASQNEHLALNPASNAKLATAAVALHVLGGDHRFSTGLYGRLRDESVGELVLRGDGDPSLTTRDLWAMAHELRLAGVHRVGSIVVDQTRFDDQYAPPAFEQQPNEWAAFRAPVSPVSLNENTLLYVVRGTKAGSEAIVSVDPPGFVDVSGTVQTTSKGDPDKLRLAVEGKGTHLRAKIGGMVPEGGHALRVARRVDDPRLLAGYGLRAALKAEGVSVGKSVKLGGEGERRLLVMHTSARLVELLDALGKDSDNFYAETLFKAVAAYSKDKPGSAADAAELVAGELTRMGAFESGVVVVNGSGLFDANRTSAWALSQLLRAAWRDPSIAHEFVSQLAVGGVDGTLRGRLTKWGAARVIRAKTGTLERVVALSGYVLAPDGEAPLAFSLLVNKAGGHINDARADMDRVVEAAAELVYEGR